MRQTLQPHLDRCIPTGSPANANLHGTISAGIYRSQRIAQLDNEVGRGAGGRQSVQQLISPAIHAVANGYIPGARTRCSETEVRIQLILVAAVIHSRIVSV